MPYEKISNSSGTNSATSDEVKLPDGGLEVCAGRAASVAVDNHGGDDDDGHKGTDNPYGLEQTYWRALAN